MPLYVTPPLSFVTYAYCRGKCNEVEQTTSYRLITDKKPVDRIRVRSESRRPSWCRSKPVYQLKERSRIAVLFSLVENKGGGYVWDLKM